MSNLFEEVLTDVNGVEERLLGPDYPYYKYIKTPSELGMSDNGSLTTLGKDVSGLISYVELLVEGSGSASATGQPLGNKFFLQTGAKCNDLSSDQEVDRYIYIDNVPAGNIPFISSGVGVNFSSFKGLIPGVISDLNVLNPYTIMQAFLSGGTPDCQELTMETIDIYNNKSTESHFVSLVDIQNMDSCIFSDKTNTVYKTKYVKKFSNNNKNNKNKKKINFDNQMFVQSYIVSLSILGIYLLYCIMLKVKR